MAKKDDKKLLETARERFKRCVEADQENRRKAVDDLKFLHVPGESWDAALRSERGNRPCYSFPRLRTTIKRVINDIRANRPTAKIRAVEDGDKDTSVVYEGLCRNIWATSDADAAVDGAAEYQVGGGMGAWRIVTEYASDTAWEQDIKIEPIRNPFALWCDPSAKDPMKRDARYWFLESRLPNDVYKEKYKDINSVEWEASEFADCDDWQDEDTTRICEYWYEVPVIKTLALLDDGSTVDLAETDPSLLIAKDEMGQPIIGPDGQPVSRIKRQRKANCKQIRMAIIGGGDKVIEQPTEWAGSRHPFVQVYGEYIVIDGKVHWFGLTRLAKDSQRSYDYSRTLAVEAVALAPQAKYWATPAQAQGHTEMWARAHKENLPFQLYNADPQSPGAPQRMPGADIPAALINEMQLSAEDIKAVTGIFDASLGQKSNESSGVAIRARQAQGEIATYNFSDNIARAVRYTHELLVDLIPKIYDSERTVRILGEDGAESYRKINSPGPNGEVINDLSRGKYDVTVTVGPNMGTQRQEAAEIYMGLMQGNPALFPIVGDLVVKTFDYPYSDEMAERLRLMAPPQIQQMLAEKEQNGGKPLDPRAMAAMAQADQAMQMVQMQTQLIQEAAAEVEGQKQEAEKAKAELQKMMADLKVQEANLKAAEAQLQANVAQAEAQLAQREMAIEGQSKDVEHAHKNMEQHASMLEQQVSQAGQQSAAELVQQALQAVQAQIDEIKKALSDPIVVQGQQSKGKRVSMRKVNGGYEAEILEG